APGDLVDDAVVGGVAALVEGDRAGLVVHIAGDDLVDVDEHRLHQAVGGGARHVGDVGGGAPLGGAQRICLLHRIELGGGDVVEQPPRPLDQLGAGGGVRVPGQALCDQVRVAVHRPEDRIHRLGGGQDQRQVEAAQ